MTSMTQLTSITTEQTFTETIAADPAEGIIVHVKVDFVATPTDNAIIAVYGGMNSSASWSDNPILEFTIDNGDDDVWIPFTLYGWRHYKIGVRRDGSTDTLTDADCRYEPDGIAA